MVETLTESFCERCGTRYEFKAPTRLNPLRKTRGFIGGLKNYLTSQDALSDAMGDAMRTEEDQLAAAQLEAFHESFNFCIGCRQYTCLNCWNDPEGRCRTCAPVAGTDDLAERLAASLGQGATPPAASATDDAPVMGQDDLQRRLGLEGWPSVDVGAAPAANGHAVHEWPTADGIGAGPRAQPEPEPIIAHEPEPLVAFEREPEPEPVVAYEPEPEPEPEAVIAEVEADPEPMMFSEPEPEPVAAEIEPEPVAAEIEPEPVVAHEPEPEQVVAEHRPLRVVAWDEDAAYEVATEFELPGEVEAEPVVAEGEPQPEPVVAEIEPEPEPVAAETAATEPEPMIGYEPEPVVAEVESEPEPVAAETAAPEPVVAETEPEVPEEPVAASAAPAEEAPEGPPTRRIAPIRETILRFPPQQAPSAPATVDQPAAVDDSPEVAARRAQLDLLGLGDPGQGPVAPERPAVIPYRSRGAAPTPQELAARGAFWDASAREVAAAAANIGVQSCGQCGLSLSANARFCRRCGTRQAQPA